MPISDKTRKLLWGKSGNRCAICRVLLSKEKTELDDHAIIGDECHIVSKSPIGPRYLPDLPYDYDGCDNLVLLCSNDHREVDAQPMEYNALVLTLIKHDHESWVASTLDKAVESTATPLTPEEEYEQTKDQTELVLLRQIKSGKQELELAKESVGYYVDYDDDTTEDNLRLIATFLQNFRDWSDCLYGTEISEKIEIVIAMQKDLRELEQIGYVALGACHDQKHRLGKDNVMTMRMAIIHVLKQDDVRIISNPEGTEKGMFAIINTWVSSFEV